MSRVWKARPLRSFAPRLRPAQDVGAIAAAMRRPEIVVVTAKVDVVEIPGGALGDHLAAPRADRPTGGDEGGEPLAFEFVMALIFARSSCHVRFRYLEPFARFSRHLRHGFRTSGREMSYCGVSEGSCVRDIGATPGCMGVVVPTGPAGAGQD